MKLRLHVQANNRSLDFEHAGPVVAMGRNPAGALVLEQDSPESVVSWEHARIDLALNGATVTDLQSTNGTFLNGKSLIGTARLALGDTVRLGQSGPLLKVAVLDLSAAPVVATPVARAAAPVARPVRSDKPVAPAARSDNKRAPARMSETRGILLSEIRRQSEAHGRRRRELAMLACIVFLMIAVLGGGLWVLRDHLGLVSKKADDAIVGTGELRDKVVALAGAVRAFRQELAGKFEAFEGQLANEEKHIAEQTAQLEKMAREDARRDQEQRKGLGKLDDLATSLDQLNEKLAKGNAKAAGAGGTAALAPRAATKAVSLKPGDRVELLFQGTSVVGSLVSITPEKVTLLIIGDQQRKDYPMKDVKAIQTRDGIFAFNTDTGTFESAVTFYRLNKSAGLFEKVESSADVYLAKDVVIENGPERYARALWASGPAGDICLGLPAPESKSPPAIEAKYLATIVTTQGEHTWNPERHDYDFKTHQARATDAKAATDKMWKEREEQRYKRLMEGYEAGTRRLKALAPLFWRSWWWW